MPAKFDVIFKKRRYRILLVGAVVVLTAYYFCLPRALFNDPYSTVLEDQDGKLLSATIATDGQWRFPLVEEVPEKFKTALITYEDKRFYSHPGVDLLSFARALRQNVRAGKVVSGGSTLTMQIIRLSRKGESRTVVEKLVEMVLASRLEWRYNKDELMALYASHAPFGGNVVGIEAACWRYFGRRPTELSWAEAAMLAVLPNAPSLMHPGKNRGALRKKRDWLLDKLKDNGLIDEFTCALAKEERIPEIPFSLPRNARHLLAKATVDGHSQRRIKSTIDSDLQLRVEQLVAAHSLTLSGNQIHNACAIVLDVETGSVLSYVGNVEDPERAHGNDVDIITSPRSTGSILKPFLYAAAMDDGKILKHTLLPDVPTIIGGFAPKNFSKQYDGAVHADQALIRSLNVPAVHLLQKYRYERLYELLKNLGMQTLNRNADHYGLSLILGGAEGTLWDISGMYASMARTLNHYFNNAGSVRYDKGDFHAPHYLVRDTLVQSVHSENSWLSAGSIYQIFDALKELYRPDEESGWRHFNSSAKIAWKTGTSFGHRDGWAVGVTPKYVVGVWVGNADGEGRPGLTGTNAAAPLMFEIFSSLKGSSWFREPRNEMTSIMVCALSGNRAGEFCDKKEKQWVQKSGLSLSPCSNHQRVYLTEDLHYRIHGNCESLSMSKAVNWFVLPPVQEYYFKNHSLSYRSLPPYRVDCANPSPLQSMAMVYPKNNARLFIPRELDGTPGRSIFELAHRFPQSNVYWHIDGEYIGQTSSVHQLAIEASAGWHNLTVIDEKGEVLRQRFEVIAKM